MSFIGWQYTYRNAAHMSLHVRFSASATVQRTRTYLRLGWSLQCTMYIMQIQKHDDNIAQNSWNSFGFRKRQREGKHWSPSPRKCTCRVQSRLLSTKKSEWDGVDTWRMLIDGLSPRFLETPHKCLEKILKLHTASSLGAVMSFPKHTHTHVHTCTCKCKWKTTYITMFSRSVHVHTPVW